MKQGIPGRTSAWTLIAAGGLGLTGPLLAQQPGAWQEGENHLATAIAAPEADRFSRLAEVKVELAWLANPTTFPYPLDVKTVGTALEITGEVCDEAVRAQVLQTARDESGMRLIDRIKINPRRGAVIQEVPEEILQREALERLRRSLPQIAPALSVSLWSHGQVVIRGAVPTFEDKVSVSRCLRQVRGCSCVVNQLSVMTLSPPTGNRAAATPVFGTAIITKPDTTALVAPTLPSKPASDRSASPIVLVQHVEEAPPVKEPVTPRPLPFVDTPRIQPVTATVPPREIPVKEVAKPRPLPLADTPRLQTVTAAAPPRENLEAINAPPPSSLAASPVESGGPIAYPTKWRRMAGPGNPVPPSQTAGLISNEPNQGAATEARPPARPVARLPEKAAFSQGSTVGLGTPENKSYVQAKQPVFATPRAENSATRVGASGQAATPYAAVTLSKPERPAPSASEGYVSSGIVLVDVQAPPVQTTPAATETKLPVVKIEPTIFAREPAAPPSRVRTEPVLPLARSQPAPTIPPPASDLKQTLNTPRRDAEPTLAASRHDSNPVPHLPHNELALATPPRDPEPKLTVSRRTDPVPQQRPHDPAPPQAAPRVDSAIVQTAHQDIPQKPKKSGADSREAYVGAGVAVFDIPEKAPESDAKQTQAPLRTVLRQRIAKVCGKPVSDVQITNLTPNSLTVHLKAQSAREGELFSARIFNMPELGPYEVSLDVDLPR